jgi:hypothetical protein
MKFDSPFWRDLEAQFRALPDATRLTATLCDGQWTVYDGPSDQRQRERLHDMFRSLARRAAIAAGAPQRANALDSWLELLRDQGAHFHRVLGDFKQDVSEPDPGPGHLENLALASAEYCVERATLALELEAVAAGGGTAAGLRRDRYPTCQWLYDHHHHPFADPELELQYWQTHVWQGHDALMQDYERMGMASWADRLEKLNRAIGGLCYDLAVLQANHLIDRGLRGEEAMLAYRNTAEKLQGQVASCRRSWCERLVISCVDDAAGLDLAQPFRRVADDLRQLLQDLPPLPAPKDQANLGGPVNRQAFVMPILKRKGWSILEWANASNVDFHTANNYLKGATHPYSSTLKKLACSLGVAVEDLPA